jgi:ABC-type thiamine transport system substrate-binding protein
MPAKVKKIAVCAYQSTLASAITAMTATVALAARFMTAGSWNAAFGLFLAGSPAIVISL